MDLNNVISLAQSAALGENDFRGQRWNKYMDNNKEYKRTDLWTIKVIEPAKAIYYPGDDIINARLNDVTFSRSTWSLPVGETPEIRGYKSIAIQANGFVKLDGTFELAFVDKQDYAIELWLKNIRDLISHPVSRFSYPVELLMYQFELSFYNTVQQKSKYFTLTNCLPKEVTVGDEDPSESSNFSAGGYKATFAFPYHEEHYNVLY